MHPVIQEADLNNTTHQNAIINLLNLYALDLQGYNKSLPGSVLKELIQGLKNMPTTLIFLAEVEQKFVGMAICFFGFSTFHAKPIINIHDFAVIKDCRRNGIGTILINAIEAKARELNCCKLTLETQEKNLSAIALYEKTGFRKSTLDESEGRTLFLSKYLSEDSI